MPAPTPEAIEQARAKVRQAKARLQLLEARASTLHRKVDARRKIVLGALILDAAKSGTWPTNFADLFRRISCERDLKPFEGWSLADD